MAAAHRFAFAFDNPSFSDRVVCMSMVAASSCDASAVAPLDDDVVMKDGGAAGTIVKRVHVRCDRRPSTLS
jgi:hypothetical protein